MMEKKVQGILLTLTIIFILTGIVEAHLGIRPALVEVDIEG